MIGKRPSCFHDQLPRQPHHHQRQGQRRARPGPDRHQLQLDLHRASVNDGDFHFVAFVREGNTLQTYVDGVADTSGTTTGVTNISNASNLIAAAAPAPASTEPRTSPARLDEIKIYDRALSLCEILAGVDAGLDLDLDGEVLPLSDMLLLLRRLFGFSGSVLAAGAVGNGCVRCGAEPLAVFIDAIGARSTSTATAR